MSRKMARMSGGFTGGKGLSLRHYSVEEVARYIDSLGLVGAPFRASNVDGVSLQRMSRADLLSMGLTACDVETLQDSMAGI